METQSYFEISADIISEIMLDTDASFHDVRNSNMSVNFWPIKEPFSGTKKKNLTNKVDNIVIKISMGD